MNNLKLALRTLRRTPFVTAVAVLSLALGIGANAAIFSLFDQMLRRPLPVPEPERLVNLGSPGPKSGSVSSGTAGRSDFVFSYPMFRDLERMQTVFTGIAAHREFAANIAYNGQTLNGQGMLVSGSYFPVLRLRPALGRLLGPDDDRAIGASFVAVLGHDYWASKLGSDPGVLGQTIIVNGQHMTIVGVAPAGFSGTTLGVRPELFVPITMHAAMTPGFKGFENRREYWAYLFARLKPGVTLAQARSALQGVYGPIIKDVEVPLQKGMSDKGLALFSAKQIAVDDGRRGQSELHKQARTPLILLFAITGIVLLSACANIANLLLARGAGRSLEMAVRLALGAGRRQLLAQLLTESCLLGMLGGAASLLVAWWTLALIGLILPTDAADFLKLELSVPVLLFAGALAIGTGLLFGMFPALHSTRPDLVSTIRANTGQPSGARAAARFRTSLVTAQIALSMTLLIAAGLFVRSLMNVSRVNLGLDADHVVTFGISPELDGDTPARSQALFERVSSELAAVPGVTAVTASSVTILADNNWGNTVSVEGFEAGPDVETNALTNEVGDGYFHAMGIPLLAGREFTRGDPAGAEQVAIVNEAFVKKFDLGRSAVGKHMALGRQEALDIEIVGVVRDAKYSSVKDEVTALYFTPYRQDTTLGSLQYYVRTSLDPAQLVHAVPAVIARVDPNLPVEDLKTLPQQVRENVYLDRMITSLSAAFAVLATLLAAVGLYGVLAYTVAQRTREFGVRMALGADGTRIRRLVMRQVTFMAAIGSAIGIAAALALGKSASSLLFALEAYDPLAIAAAVIVLALVAMAAGYIPALRASRVDPMQALRSE